MHFLLFINFLWNLYTDKDFTILLAFVINFTSTINLNCALRICWVEKIKKIKRLTDLVVLEATCPVPWFCHLCWIYGVFQLKNNRDSVIIVIILSKSNLYTPQKSFSIYKRTTWLKLMLFKTRRHFKIVLVSFPMRSSVNVKYLNGNWYTLFWPIKHIFFCQTTLQF